MGDSYREILIKKQPTSADTVKKIGLIVLTVLFFAAGLFIHPFLLPAGIVLGVIAYFFVLPRLDVEYEYLYVNGELDIDAIYAKQKRKKIGSYKIEELEIVAKDNSHALDSFRNKGKVQDYTSGIADVAAYIMVFNHDGNTRMIKVEIDEEIINDIRRLAPRKVNLN